jgi:starch synthase
MNILESQIRTRMLFLTAESSPYIKVGGLGDVSGSLPPLLARMYPDLLDIRMVMPYHANLKLDPKAAKVVCEFQVSYPALKEKITAWQDNSASFPVYFLQSETLSKTPPYTEDWVFDLQKYTLFSLAVHKFMDTLQWIPDIYHGNDWHTALAIYQTGTRAFKQNTNKPFKTMLSIHNLPYMGLANRKVLAQFGIRPSQNQSLPDWARDIPLPMGMSRTDIISTVSNGYAQEIMTPEFGCGLDGFLQAKSVNVRGILNGIDPQEWDPTSDPHLVAHFSQATLQDRLANKKALFTQYFSKSKPSLPLLIWVGRLQGQKGADVFLDSLRNLLDQDWRCIILGTGDPALEESVTSLSSQYPEKIHGILKFDNAFSHQLYAGGDMIIMPSRYEPCGLSQMFAMRYGCLPIATATGGLKDTISDYSANLNSDGFLFLQPTVQACTESIQKALEIYSLNPQKWQTMQCTAMQKDFSWERSAEQYKDVYLNLLENR